jgi:hypothetical protein
MKNIIFCVLLFNFFGNLSADEEFHVNLIVKDTLTQFRRMDQPKAEATSLVGLEKLKFSASEQFTQSGLLKLIMDLSKERLTIVDLRREYHGFVSSHAVALSLSQVVQGPFEYNAGLSLKKIEEGELRFLHHLSEEGSFIGKKKDLTEEIIQVESYFTEQGLAEQAGAEYRRIPILDHTRPLDPEVDEIIHLVKNLPANGWLHIHCAGGKGRTTTVSCMIDMMYNSSELSAYEIIQRQQTLGGSNLWDVEENYKNKDPITFERGIERREFLRLFHQYCLQNPDYKINWSEWNKN